MAGFEFGANVEASVMTIHPGCMPCKRHSTQPVRMLIVTLYRWNVVECDENDAHPLTHKDF